MSARAGQSPPPSHLRASDARPARGPAAACGPTASGARPHIAAHPSLLAGPALAREHLPLHPPYPCQAPSRLLPAAPPTPVDRGSFSVSAAELHYRTCILIQQEHAGSTADAVPDVTRGGGGYRGIGKRGISPPGARHPSPARRGVPCAGRSGQGDSLRPQNVLATCG